MKIAKQLSKRSKAAAEFMKTVGWAQGTMKDEKGRVCATGAVMYCQPKDGDEQIILQVLRRLDRAESFNDTDGRTMEEVYAALSADITDEQLADTFGPQWAEIVALVRRAATLTDAEVSEFGARYAAPYAARYTAPYAARDAAWYAAWYAARDAAWYAARGAASGAAWGAARGAASGAARGAASGAAWGAAWGAASALVTRDLIGTGGYTQAHYDLLTREWRAVIGHTHPDDV